MTPYVIVAWQEMVAWNRIRQFYFFSPRNFQSFLHDDSSKYFFVFDVELQLQGRQEKSTEIP